MELCGSGPEFVFWIEGRYEVQLKVTDSVGQTGLDFVTVTASGFIPEFGSLSLASVAGAVVLTVLALGSRMRRRQGA